VELSNLLPALPGVIAHLDAARDAGIPVAIASSSSGWWVEDHLARLGLRGRFAAVCTKESAPRTKPDPGVYLAAIGQLGIDPAGAVAFEDSSHGVAAARAAGLSVVAVPGSFSEGSDFSAASVVVESLALEMPAALWARALVG
jgi:HAD superfamily hydrolase (TIGR01509 family)